jgi:hypothetical protein
MSYDDRRGNGSGAGDERERPSTDRLRLYVGGLDPSITEVRHTTQHNMIHSR